MLHIQSYTVKTIWICVTVIIILLLLSFTAYFYCNCVLMWVWVFVIFLINTIQYNYVRTAKPTTIIYQLSEIKVDQPVSSSLNSILHDLCRLEEYRQFGPKTLGTFWNSDLGDFGMSKVSQHFGTGAKVSSEHFGIIHTENKQFYTVSQKMCKLIFCSISVKYKPISIKIGWHVLEETLD